MDRLLIFEKNRIRLFAFDVNWRELTNDIGWKILSKPRKCYERLDFKKKTRI